MTTKEIINTILDVISTVIILYELYLMITGNDKWVKGGFVVLIVVILWAATLC